MISREYKKKIFQDTPSGYGVVILFITTSCSKKPPPWCCTDFVFSLATVEKPCVSNNHTILVFGEIPVIPGFNFLSTFIGDTLK